MTLNLKRATFALMCLTNGHLFASNTPMELDEEKTPTSSSTTTTTTTTTTTSTTSTGSTLEALNPLRNSATLFGPSKASSDYEKEETPSFNEEKGETKEATRGIKRKQDEISFSEKKEKNKSPKKRKKEKEKITEEEEETERSLSPKRGPKRTREEEVKLPKPTNRFLFDREESDEEENNTSAPIVAKEKPDVPREPFSLFRGRLQNKILSRPRRGAFSTEDLKQLLQQQEDETLHRVRSRYGSAVASYISQDRQGDYQARSKPTTPTSER